MAEACFYLLFIIYNEDCAFLRGALTFLFFLWGLSTPTGYASEGKKEIVYHFQRPPPRAGHVPTFLKSFRSVLERGASA